MLNLFRFAKEGVSDIFEVHQKFPSRFSLEVTWPVYFPDIKINPYLQ